MLISESSKGSATVEASIVFPLVVISIISLLLIGIKMVEKVRTSAELNMLYALETMEPAVPAETLLRLKWMGINYLENGEE